MGETRMVPVVPSRLNFEGTTVLCCPSINVGIIFQQAMSLHGRLSSAHLVWIRLSQELLIHLGPQVRNHLGY